MKTVTNVKKIFLMSQPLGNLEWLTLLSDKYLANQGFHIETTWDFDSADIIAWDGVISPKLELYLPRILENLNRGKILILMGEARTLLQKHSIISLLDLKGLNVIDLPGWTIIPEDIILALSSDRQKN